MISSWVAVCEQQFAGVHLVKKGVGTHMLYISAVVKCFLLWLVPLERILRFCQLIAVSKQMHFVYFIINHYISAE